MVFTVEILKDLLALQICVLARKGQSDLLIPSDAFSCQVSKFIQVTHPLTYP